ncbi:MAG TPA: N-6 DNA methylase, partial [Anaerolineales bacterium]|nr:N-6 DNA methylase [Anaerolineales bacterium]
GVYYTPSYIVEYIVKNTVGKLVEDKNPDEVSKIKIVDPACGSGSFLLGAYQFLLDWHLDYYASHSPEKWVKNKTLLTADNKTYRLSIDEKKRILLNNIHGVDLDPQAVEVTKLSLLLKVVEDPGQLKMFEEGHILPNLNKNIKNGNALIGTDYFSGQMFGDMEEMKRIKPFDWKSEFPEVFKRGGFDVVVGNPPYIRIQRIDHADADYLYKKYKSPTSKADISLVFLENSLTILNSRGIAGLICTSQWLTTDYGKNLRAMLSDGKLSAIVDFGSLPVFESAQTYPAIFILSLNTTNRLEYKKIETADQLNLSAIEKVSTLPIELDKLGSSPWKLGSLDIINLLNEKTISWKSLSEIGGAYIGALTGMDDAFVVINEDIQNEKLEQELLLPYAYRAGDIEKFSVVVPRAKVIYPYKEGKNGSPELIAEEKIKELFPNIHKHLLKYKDALRKRMDSRKHYASGIDWYRYLRPGSYNYINPPKLIIKGIDVNTTVGLLPQYSVFNGANCPGIILENLANHSELYVLGLLNSIVVSYYLKSVCPPKLGGYRRFNANNLNAIPIRTINFNDLAEKSKHDKMVSLVEKMLALHKSMAEAKTPQEGELIKRQITSTDKAIDSLVYELYGLSEEEIGIVEGEK